METRSPGVLSQSDSEAREKGLAKAQGQLQDPPCMGKQLSAESFQLDTDSSAGRGGVGGIWAHQEGDWEGGEVDILRLTLILLRRHH